MGRPKGSRNRVSRELRRIFEKLEKEENIKPAMWIRRLHQIAMGEGKDVEVSDSIHAADRLLRFAFGNPASSLQLEHEIGPGAEDLLRRIAQSEAHRLTLEKLEARRLKAASVTVEVQSAEAPEVRSPDAAPTKGETLAG